MKKSQDEAERLAGRIHAQAQTDIPASQIRDQIAPKNLGPRGNTGSGYTPAAHEHTTDGQGGPLTADEHLTYSEYTEISTPATPDANKARLYTKDKGGVSTLYYLDDTGTEHDLSAAGFPAGATGDMFYVDNTGTVVLLEMAGVPLGSSIYATDVGGDTIPFWDFQPPRGGASGDLGGTYPDPLVTGLQGFPISTSDPITGDVLVFDGSMYSPSPAGSGTVTSVDITQPAAGITASGGPITTSGAITLALANDLAALEALSSTGLAVRTGTDTWAQRTITGTSNRLSVSNGDGVSGNPTLDIDAAYVGQTSIITLGTIGTGVWQGTKIGLAYGGTNADLSATGGANQIVRQNSSGGAFTVSVLAAGDIPTLTAAKISDFDTQVRTSSLNQMTAPTADLSINSHKLTNVTDPTADQDAATKAYVDAVAQGLAVKGSARLATAAALPSNTYLAGVLTGVSTGVLTVDGSTVALNDRILVKDEAAQANNGLYVCTTAGAIGVAYVLTRTADMNAATEIPGAFAFVEAGTANAGAGFVVAGAGPYVVGTTAIVWTQFSGAGEITAGTGLSKSGNTLSISASYVGQTSITTLGTIATGTWQGTAVDAAHGGTGQTSYAVGDLLYASASTTLSKLADVATGNVLISGGVTTAPSWGKVDLTAHVSGILPSANGGTGVNNAGTITNATNTTITGGGTIALGGFTLTVPATGSAALLATANTFTAAQTVNLGGSSNQNIIGALSGGAANFAGMSVGLTTLTTHLAVAGASNNFFAGTVVGDAILTNDTSGSELFLAADGAVGIRLGGGSLGFYGSAGSTKQTITGVRTGTLAQLQTVVGNLLTALANMGQVTNSTT